MKREHKENSKAYEEKLRRLNGLATINREKIEKYEKVIEGLEDNIVAITKDKGSMEKELTETLIEVQKREQEIREKEQRLHEEMRRQESLGKGTERQSVSKEQKEKFLKDDQPEETQKMGEFEEQEQRP